MVLSLSSCTTVYSFCGDSFSVWCVFILETTRWYSYHYTFWWVHSISCILSTSSHSIRKGKAILNSSMNWWFSLLVIIW